MITLKEYLGPWSNHVDATVARCENAERLLESVNALLAWAVGSGLELPVNPATHSHVGGQTYGGFRPQSCPQGAPRSSHKEGLAVDVYDPTNALDDLLDDHMLTSYGLYREHPDDTPGWCHLTIKAPGSGRRTFKP